MPPLTPRPAENPASLIKVMLVDDSAVIRGALTGILAADPDIKIVSSISDGAMAMAEAASNAPDVIILDSEMPGMGGLAALPEILKSSPQSRVVLFTASSEKGALAAMEALHLGAADYLIQPATPQLTGQGSKFQKDFLQLVQTLGRHDKKNETLVLPDANLNPAIIAIGSSSCATAALLNLLKNLKNISVPILISQHMPPTFTKALAAHIEKRTGIPAHEGVDGMPLQNGHIYVAPGGYHISLVKKDGGVTIAFDDGAPENARKPSADPMFRAVSAIYGERAVGVILQGCGEDGLAGAQIVTNAGGRVIRPR